MVIQVVVPIGGKGTRFLKAGIDTPKPLIDVLGKPMFLRAIESVTTFAPDARLIFVIRQDQNRNHHLSEKIKKHLPNAQVVVMEQESPGASTTVMAASALLDPDLPLLVLDCDIAFESENYAEKIKRAIAGEASGVLLSFYSTDARYSFAEIDSNGFVIQTAEKRTISTNALMGSYFFTKTSDFLDAAKSLNQEALTATMPEYYMSLTFNYLLAAGKKVSLASGKFYCFGTPEELNDFLQTGKPISS
jgi:dTDP-glucose pyrophosphorylase